MDDIRPDTSGDENPDVSCDVKPEVSGDMNPDVKMEDMNPNVSDTLSTVNDYRCPHCKSTFSGAAGKVFYYQHIAKHTGKQMFKCQACGKRYTLKHHLIRHLFERKPSPCLALTKCSTDTDKLECKVCAKTFTGKDDFVLHILDHESSSCGESDDTTPGAQSAPTPHPQSASTPRAQSAQSKIMCYKCLKTFDTKEARDLHKNQCTAEPVECPECGKFFVCGSRMRVHLSNIHADVKGFLCHICGWLFSYKSGLTQHLRMHAGINNYECHDCGRKFLNIFRLKNHIARHTGEKPFECQECTKRFFTKKELKEHSFTHSGIKKFECQVCGKAFAWKQNRDAHLRVHSRKAFQCDNCGQEFTKKGALTKHMLTHDTTEHVDGQEC